MSIGLPHRDDRCTIDSPVPNRVPKQGTGGITRKEEIPLECGITDGETRTRTVETTIFQSLVGISLTAAQCLQLSGLSPAEPNQVDDRKLRSFLVDLGSGMRSGAQWSAAARAAPRRAATRRGTRRGVRGGLRAGRLLGDARRDVRQTWAGSEIPISLHSRAASDSMPSEWERSCAPLSAPTGSRAT